MTSYVAAIDQGTTSTRCMIFDHSGRVVAVDQREHEQIFPQAGWVEHNAEEIWENTRAVAAGALAKADLRPTDIAAVGITNQRETALVWDRKTGKPVYNAIVWQDTRTDKIATELGALGGGQERYRSKTGLPLATYFSGPKIKWILDNVEGARARAEAGDLVFGNMDTWVLWNMTGGTDGGVHVTDPTNASRTLLMNLDTLQWDEDIAAEMGIPLSMLPEIRSSSEVYGKVRPRGALAEVPIAGILGDQQAATFGQACLSPGEAKNTYGTGNFVLLNTGTEKVLSENGLLTTVCYKIGSNDTVYALEGSVAVTGSLVQVAAGQPGVDFVGGADRGIRPNGRRQRRRVLRTGVLRPVRPVLALRRTRRDRRPDPVREQGPHLAGGAGGDGIPVARGDRRDERRLGCPAEVPEGRRRDGRQRAADAVPGGHPRRAGDPPGGERDDRTGRGVRDRSGGRVLEVGGRHPHELGEGQAVGPVDGRVPAGEGIPELEEGGDEDLRLGGGLIPR